MKQSNYVHYQAGVDGSVVALLNKQSNQKKSLICIMVDTGLMRKNEFRYAYKIFKKI